MTPDPELGEIITFYSYKGGTGRSMAMANVACLLAQHQVQKAGKGVLVVDWDLEAPGLHRFFRERLRRRFGSAPTTIGRSTSIRASSISSAYCKAPLPN